jgi:diadenosine tetraphosphate (Ap4A) HIT family hydrolase
MPRFMCSIDPERIIAENELAAAIRDGFPVSPGHTLVITKTMGAHLDN